jgi:hypothetical protein
LKRVGNSELSTFECRTKGRHEIANQPRIDVVSMRDDRTDVAIGEPSVELVEMTRL